jgi:hypothetical protein
MRFLSLLLVLSVLELGCSSSEGSGSGGSSGTGGAGGTAGFDANDMVRVERFFTAGFVPDANPETAEDTPNELNQARVVRYFTADEPSPAPRAIVIAMPGFLGGGPSFDGIARSVVRRCTEDGFPVEFWAIDRRSNGLEDLTGMNAAEREGDAEIAWGYYFDGAEVDGETFAGYVPQEDVSYMSEWGLIEDPIRDNTFEILFGLGVNQMPKATNIATLGLAFDSMHQPLSFSRTTLGTLTGGPTEDFTFPIAGDDVLQRPSDPDATYDWIDAFDSDPPEFTPARNLARSFTIGESNFAEWYFPQRISLDAGAARGGNVDEAGWQVTYGIRAFDGDLNDAPALCILARNADRCDALRTRLAPTIGAQAVHARTRPERATSA